MKLYKQYDVYICLNFLHLTNKIKISRCEIKKKTFHDIFHQSMVAYQFFQFLQSVTIPDLN